jgi:uncharacterized protein YjbJ (UPF0337 family)
MSDRERDEKLAQKGLQHKVKGTANEAVGKVRGKLGDLTDNGSEHVKGKLQEVKGKVQKKAGQLEENLSVARDRKEEVEED